jgi:hypothetical protein
MEEDIMHVYPELDERLTKFILDQLVFFVATAPCLDASGQGGHINVSPKGYRETPPASTGCRPSADPLFAAAEPCVQRRSLATS